MVSATNKFGKIAGPGASATPATNSVTTDKILNGTIATADMAAKSVTAALLGSDVAGAGIGGGNGNPLTFDADGLTIDTVDVAADYFVIDDATDAVSDKVLVSGLVTAMAGTASSSGLSATSGVLKVAPADSGSLAVSTDYFAYVTGTGAYTRKDLVSDVVTAIADGTTLSAAAGVMSVKTSSLGITQMAVSDQASVMIFAHAHDFSSGAAATNTDLGTLGAKGTFIGGYAVLTEALAGGNSATQNISVGPSGGVNPYAVAITITQANTTIENRVGNTFGLYPNATYGANLTAGTHIYANTAIDSGSPARSAGKAYIVLFFQKVA